MATKVICLVVAHHRLSKWVPRAASGVVMAALTAGLLMLLASMVYASVVEFKVEVPGNYILVDHALTRVERGLAGILKVDGPDNPEVFKDYNPKRSALSTGH